MSYHSIAVGLDGYGIISRFLRVIFSKESLVILQHVRQLEEGEINHRRIHLAIKLLVDEDLNFTQ